jgi:hypothetical protein
MTAWLKQFAKEKENYSKACTRRLLNIGAIINEKVVEIQEKIGLAPSVQQDRGQKTHGLLEM